MYIEREIEKVFTEYLGQFKVVLVTGSRQVGKSTMIRHVLPDSYHYIALDDLEMLARIRSDSALFFMENDLPLAIDEIQYAPELFMRIKNIVDQSDAKGTIVLTGSQTHRLMQGVSESLAGRVGILEMSSLSLRELTGRLKHEPFIPSFMKGASAKSSSDLDLWTHIQRGSMPELAQGDIDPYAYYSSYVRTYIERDVRDLLKVKDERVFYDFMVACAARTGQLINASEIGGTIGVDATTIKGWLSVLQTSGVIHIMQPFSVNANKRLSKTPKLYFFDTGLVCHLAAWNTPEALRRGASAGRIFETFIVSEVLKSFMNAGRDLREVSFYRDARKREIDLIIRNGRVLHPVEIKVSATVDTHAVKNFSVLDDLADYERGFGAVICQTEKPYLITENVQAISPWEI